MVKKNKVKENTKGEKKQSEKKSKSSKSISFKLDMNLIVKNWATILLIAIMIFGFSLRLYHLDYPVIGYHNQKEVHYLTETRNFAEDGFFKNGFLIPRRDSFDNQFPDGVHGDTLPLIHLFGVPMYLIFGPQEWALRLPGMLMNLFTILIMYLFIRKLFKREDIALTAAFLTALNPLFVFFSHNYQLVNPGLFFMMLGGYMFLLWKEKRTMLTLALASFFISIAGAAKYPFIIILVPIAFIFPYKDVFSNIKKYLPALSVATVIFLIIVVGWFFHELAHQPVNTIGGSYEAQSIGGFSALFSDQFKATTPSYIADSFTTIGAWFCLFGIILSLLMFAFKKRTDGEWFLIGSIVGIAIFMVIMSSKVAGHNYHYFPITPLIIIFIAYFLLVVGNTLGTFVKEYQQYILAIIIILGLIVVYKPSIEAKNRQFDTQFHGLDVAGQYIFEHKNSGDEMMHSGHQSYGVSWYGDIQSTRGIPKKLDEFKQIEQTRNIQWLLIYQWGFNVKNNPKLWNYITNNYSLNQMGFFQQQGKVSITYYLMRKGGSFNESNLNYMFQGKPVYNKIYDTSRGKVTFNYINI